MLPHTVAPYEARMLDQEAITQQLDLLADARSEDLLAAHRRALAVYLRQQAGLGVLAPLGRVSASTQAHVQRATR